MAANKTANIGLNQWQPDERVRREDFNEDNRLIDAALSHVGNCRVVVGEYVGDGDLSKRMSLTFDGKPEIAIIAGNWMRLCVRGDTQARLFSAGDVRVAGIGWSENAVSWGGDATLNLMLNEDGGVYHYIALLSPGTA